MTKRLLLIGATAVLASALLAACSAPSTVVRKDGTKEEISDFKASADANAKMYSDQADVMWNAHEADKKCFEKATTDNQIAFCTLGAQTTKFTQAMSGRPTPNRNPSTGVEETGATVRSVGGDVAGAAKTVGVAKAAASAVKSTVDAQSAVQTTVVTQPAPLVVRPEVVQPTVVTVPAATEGAATQ